MPEKKGRAGEKTLAQTAGLFSIHVITASGTAWAFLALIAAANGSWEHMFLWLGVALLVDALDGPLARRAKLAEKMPRWSGETLDLVVDFVTYVFVPAYAIASCGLLPDGVALFAGIAIVITSAIYFSDRAMKTEDNYFQGFPAIWNVAVFYLLLMAPPPGLATLFVGILMIMTFLPIPFIHPLRVIRWRRFNIALMVIWSLLALSALGHHMAAGPLVTGTLCVIGLYILGGGVIAGKRA